jgi:hypothetical protein
MFEKLELILRWTFAIQIIFWGANGFLHFVKIPPSSPKITNFVDSCIEIKFIMPIVKIIEIFCGLSLLFDFALGLNLLILSPVIFVITFLQLFHNPKPWAVVLPISTPFLFLFFWHCRAVIILAAQ